MKKLFFYVFFIIYLLPILAIGQTGYIVTDSSVVAAKIDTENGDSFNGGFCRVRNGRVWEYYNPYLIKEYGFGDGRVFISREVQLSGSNQKVFLERLQQGKATLYSFKETTGVQTFFIEKDSTLYVIDKKISKDRGYKDKLLEITSDCKAVEDAIKVVEYKKETFTKLIKQYNTCEFAPMPHFRYGLTVSSSYLKLVLRSGNELLNYFDFNYVRGYTIGLFADKPIIASNFSYHVELYYSKHGMSYNKFVDTADYDFVANFSSLKLPILIRYVYPSNKIRPFLNIGVTASFGIKNETLLYKSVIGKDGIDVNKVDESSVLKSNQFGFSMGGGFEFRLKNKHALFIELRSNIYYEDFYINYNNPVKISEYNFITGINF